MKKILLLALASLFLSGRATAQTATVTADATTFAPGGGQVTLTASIVYPAGTNGITGVVVKNGGSGYTTAPAVAFVGGGGTGATATATLDGRVTSVALAVAGSGYTAPTVTLVGGGGTGATATATVTGGAITSFSITGGGTGYTSVPNVVLSDPTGTDASGTASITKVVSAVAVTSSGSGYADFPAVTFTGGGGTGATADAAVLTPTALGFLFNIPAGWALVSTGGANVPQTAQPVGTTAILEYAYSSFPANVASFTVTVSYPAGLVGNQTITPEAIYRSPVTNISIAPVVISPPIAPTITTQPVNTTVGAGSNATFTVAAVGPPAPAIKWQRSIDGGVTFADLSNDAAFSGVATSTLAITSVPSSMHGNRFRAMASNGALPDATSSAAILSVNSAPVFVTHPRSQTVSTGGNLLLTAAAAGFPAPSYQWMKGATILADGVRISGATTSTLTVSSVQVGDEGSYTVVANNGITPNATSDPAVIALAPSGFSATHALQGPGYTPGGTVAVTSTLNYTGELSSLTWSVLLPVGWTFESSVNAGNPSTAPGIGDSLVIDWLWASAPTSGSTFTYVLKTPTNASGNQTLTALVEYGVGVTPIMIVATPDPLRVNQIFLHSADTNQNSKIDATELSRLIVLYNTRYTSPIDGSRVRTGSYKLQSGTVDGFGTENTRESTAVVTLPAYHAADTNRNGKIDATELSRVIVLYNTRYTSPVDGSKVRTGFYKVAVGVTTVDGYTTDPTRAP